MDAPRRLSAQPAARSPQPAARSPQPAARSPQPILMPLSISVGAPTILIHRPAFERAGLTRTQVDERFNLTPDEFRVERDLVAIGPLHGDDISRVIEELEDAGLTYFEDFFELTGNWPDWVSVFAAG